MRVLRDIIILEAVKMFMKISAFAGVILALIPFVLFPVCESLRPDGSHMACWYSGIFITVAGVVIAILSCVKRFRVMSLIASMCLAVSCWLVPHRVIDIVPLGLCGDLSHSCRAEMMPAVGVIVCVVVCVSFAGLIMGFVRGK